MARAPAVAGDRGAAGGRPPRRLSASARDARRCSATRRPSACWPRRSPADACITPGCSPDAQGIGKATLAYRLARAALAPPEERDASGQSLDVAATTSAARQVRALSHPGLLVLRRPYDAKAKRFATSIPVDEVRRLQSFLAHRAAGDGAGASSSSTRPTSSTSTPPTRCSSRWRSRRRARCSCSSPSEPGRLAADHPLALPHACPAAARRERLARRGHPGAGRGRDEIAAGRRMGRIGAARRGQRAPGACSCSPPAGWSCKSASPSCCSLLPQVDWRRRTRCADELQPIAAQQRFELFFELLLDALARLIRAAPAGEGSPEDRALAARADRRVPGLPRWAALWERIAARQGRRRGSTSTARPYLVRDSWREPRAAAAQDPESPP